MSLSTDDRGDYNVTFCLNTSFKPIHGRAPTRCSKGYGGGFDFPDRNRLLRVAFCRSRRTRALVKFDVYDWSSRVQKDGQVRAITQLRYSSTADDKSAGALFKRQDGSVFNQPRHAAPLNGAALVSAGSSCSRVYGAVFRSQSVIQPCPLARVPELG